VTKVTLFAHASNVRVMTFQEKPYNERLHTAVKGTLFSR